jgi:hypothetical protein
MVTLIVKDDYAQAKTYFKILVKDFETYTHSTAAEKQARWDMKAPTT